MLLQQANLVSHMVKSAVCVVLHNKNGWFKQQLHIHDHWLLTWTTPLLRPTATAAPSCTQETDETYSEAEDNSMSCIIVALSAFHRNTALPKATVRMLVGDQSRRFRSEMIVEIKTNENWRCFAVNLPFYYCCYWKHYLNTWTWNLVYLMCAW